MDDVNTKLKNYKLKFIPIVSGFMFRIKIPSKIVFFIIGTLSTCWFLIRIIPKPNRATYPCMQTAYPFMSGFIAYLLGLVTSAIALKKLRTSFGKAKYLTGIVLLIVAIFTSIIILTYDTLPVYANSKLLLAPNQPIGVPRGINPGRVVWVWDPNSTNENCTNQFGDGWFIEKNTNLNVVSNMVKESVMNLTGKNSINDSWDALFMYFNENHGKGQIGYKEGEKIFVRTNQVSASDNTIDADYNVKNTTRYGMAETSPQVVLCILRQLINECGIKQEVISVGDPMKHMYKHFYDMLHNEFPNVVYLDYNGTAGRTKPISSSRPSIYYSDRGAILKSSGSTGSSIYSDYFPTVINEANYIIAIPAMKAHARAGVTLCAKLHFGSNLRGSATHLHNGLVSPDKVPGRTGYGLYRVQVDLMGHKDLGGKTVLFLLDALWSGSEANDPPRKFKMAPFNNDWTSSIFVSQDQIGLESVGYDFLKTEFTFDNTYGSYPQIYGVDDYIMQAADSSYWPQGIKYDPENDGSLIQSLGVCEHWNNPIDKLYSRNLKIGNGIELIYLNKSPTSSSEEVAGIPGSFKLFQNYPNPFNPSTKINYQLPRSGNVSLVIYDLQGRKTATLVNGYQMEGKYEYTWYPTLSNPNSTGIYFAKLQMHEFSKTIKMILIK